MVGLNISLSKEHTEVVFFVKFNWAKLYLKILITVTCLGFYNIEEFYQPICCTYHNLYMNFANILCFFLNFSTSWKSWVKEQWPTKSLFHIVWLHDLCLEAKKRRGGIIFEFLKSWWLTKSTKDTCSWIFLRFLVNKSWAEAVHGQNWTFETDNTQKLHFYAVSWHKHLPDDQTVKFWHQVS